MKRQFGLHHDVLREIFMFIFRIQPKTKHPLGLYFEECVLELVVVYCGNVEL